MARDFQWDKVLGQNLIAKWSFFCQVTKISLLLLIMGHFDNGRMIKIIILFEAFEGTVLSAFFGGYAATQLLGGQLADALGAKWVLAAGLSCWSLATALTPWAAESGALLPTRLALGLGEGGFFEKDGAPKRARGYCFFFGQKIIIGN